jgi:hypothetical protein
VALDPSSILLVTLDSCRYDTFCAANAPNLKKVGALRRAHAPGSFTFSSHSAMFVGYTPGVEDAEPYANPRYGRIFRLVGGGGAGASEPWVLLSGANIVDGLRRLGYLTVGTGAVGWFNPDVVTSRPLVSPFDEFFFKGGSGGRFDVRQQVTFAMNQAENARQPLFLFMNIGETHIPYWHEGASWKFDKGPCHAFADDNDAEACRERQRACLEYVDAQLAPVLDLFESANAIICADHGDAWGEDGLWGHGFHHPKVLEVPLIYRLLNRPPMEPPAATGPHNTARIAGSAKGWRRRFNR